MEKKDLIISTLHNLNQNLVKEVSELWKEQEKSKVALHHTSTYYLRDSRLVNDLMKEHQDQANAWYTCFEEMEENLTLLIEKFFTEIKEK